MFYPRRAAEDLEPFYWVTDIPPCYPQFKVHEPGNILAKKIGVI
jgi:hypothetical protein